MKLATQEEIIATGIQVIKFFYNEDCSNDSVKAKRWWVNLIASEEGTYEHNGWSLRLYPNEPSGTEFHSIHFLQDGKPISVTSFDKGELTPNNRTIYIYMSEEGIYKPISRDKYFEHHTFPFEDKELFTFKPY